MKKIGGRGSPMKKKDDGVGGTHDPGVTLFWVDDGLESTATTAPAWPRVPVKEQTSDAHSTQTMFDMIDTTEESAIRSVVKTVSWRILATVTTVCVIYALTDDGDLAMTIGYLDATIKMALYYFHERIWNRSRIGKTNIRA